jgi:transposase
MDTVDERLAVKAVGKKIRRRSIKERRDIVEETLQAGTSVSRVARRHDVNANQVFYWRKLYREGRLGGSRVSPLLPVEIAKERSVKEDAVARAGSMEILLAKGTLRVVGAVDVIALRAVLECLAG